MPIEINGEKLAILDSIYYMFISTFLKIPSGALKTTCVSLFFFKSQENRGFFELTIKLLLPKLCEQ